MDDKTQSQHKLHLPSWIKSRYTFCVLLVVIGLIIRYFLAHITLPGYTNQNGITDLGHYIVPPLLPMVGLKNTQIIWWASTLVLELLVCIVWVRLVITGRGRQFLFTFSTIQALAWITWHTTVFTVPDYISWQNPSWAWSLTVSHTSDFWFSAHVASATIFLFYLRGLPIFLKTLAWAFFVFQVWLVLACRVHYTVDVIGALFVTYTIQSLTSKLRLIYYEHFE